MNPGSPDGGPSSPLRSIVLFVFVLLLVLTVALIIASIPAGFYAVFSGNLSSKYGVDSLLRPYYWIGPQVEYLPLILSVGEWFVLLVAVYSLFLLFAFLQEEGPIRTISRAFGRGFQELTSSPFIVTVIAIGFLTFTASEMDVIVSAAGVPIGNLTGDPLELFVGFTASPLVEEIGFRVVLIGVVALILSMGRPWKAALGSLWRPSKALEGLAVGSGASIIIWTATGLSAATFGACHVLCGSAWDIGKLPEATYGGIVLGYLYVKYGLHVAVLTHWGIDFFGSAFSFYGQAAYGIAWNSGSAEFVGQSLVDYDMLFLFGLASFLVVLYLGLRKFFRRGQPEVSGEIDKGPPGGPSVLR